MAQDFGARLLAEVKECSLAEVLASIQRTKQPRNVRWTGIHYIDDLVHAFGQGHRYQTQQPQAQPEPGILPDQNHNANIRPPVVEIASVSPAAGKTQLLYLIATYHLLGLPSSLPPVATPLRGTRKLEVETDGGTSNDTHREFTSHASLSQPSPGTVVYLDLQSRFSAHRLLSILKSQLSRLPYTDPSSADPGAAKEAHIQDQALAALSHIHVFRPQTSRSLLATLNSIQGYLFDLSAHHSADRPLRAILISDLSAFYWADRYEGEVEAVELIGAKSGQGAAAGGARNQDDVLSQNWRDIVAALRSLQAVLRCPVIGTNMALAKMQMTRDGMAVPPHLPGAWNGLVSVKMILQRERVKFGSTSSAEEALLEQKWRLEKGERAVSRLRVNMWKCDEWDEPVREAVEALVRRHKCSLLLDEGIEIIVEDRQ